MHRRKKEKHNDGDDVQGTYGSDISKDTWKGQGSGDMSLGHVAATLASPRVTQILTLRDVP